MLLQTTFIYQPKSGDRVLIEAPADGIAVVRWNNGCRHVIGGVHLEYNTAEPGKYWRTQARQMARILVERIGGIAWDEQGTVHLVANLRWAWDANDWMESAALATGIHLDYLRRNQAALALAGYQLGDQQGHPFSVRGILNRYEIVSWRNWARSNGSIWLAGEQGDNAQPFVYNLKSPWWCSQVNQGCLYEITEEELEQCSVPKKLEHAPAPEVTCKYEP